MTPISKTNNIHSTLTTRRNNYGRKRKRCRWRLWTNHLYSYSANNLFSSIIGDLLFIMVATTGYLLNRFYYSGCRFPFFKNHFNDLLAGISFPAYVNILLTLYGKRMKGWLIPLIVILIAGLFWEYVTPLYHHCVSDSKDIIAYIVGTFIYSTTTVLFDKKNKNKHNRT